MAAEIAEQPAVLSRLLASGAGPIRRIAARLSARPPRSVVITARGSSGHAALYLKYLLEIGLGVPVSLLAPSVVTLYDARPISRDVVLVCVSQSGISSGLLATAEWATRGGARTVGITNSPGSPLARLCADHIDIGAGPETSVAATKTFTAELLACYLLADAWRGGDGSAASGVPEAVARMVAAGDRVMPLLGGLRNAGTLVCVGRGYAHPTARELALKLMETCYLPAQAFSTAELMHGPLAMLDPDVPVLAVVPDGAAGEATSALLERLSGTGAPLVLAGGPIHARREGSGSLLMDHRLPEELAPIGDIPLLQLLALELSRARGLDPDSPRGLAKVTDTR